MDLSVKNMAIAPSPTLAIDAKFKEMKANGEDVVGFGCGEPDLIHLSILKMLLSKQLMMDLQNIHLHQVHLNLKRQ